MPTLVVIAVVLLVLAACGLLIARSAVLLGRARETVSAFFEDLENGRYEQAHGLLCARTREQHPAARFAADLAQRTPVSHQATGPARINRMPRGTTGTIGVRVGYADGSSEERLVPLRREHGKWRISGSPY